jgi:hypothetical protein
VKECAAAWRQEGSGRGGKMESVMRICSFAALLAIGGLLTVYPVRAAQHTGRLVRETPPVKLEVTGLSIIPAQPEPGQPVTVKLTIKNAGAGSVVKVPWSIHYATGNQTLASGEQQNVTAGSSFEATVTWTAKAGAQKLQGYVDPKGTLKNTAPSASQVTDLNITVPQVPAAHSLSWAAQGLGRKDNFAFASDAADTEPIQF